METLGRNASRSEGLLESANGREWVEVTELRTLWLICATLHGVAGELKDATDRTDAS